MGKSLIKTFGTMAVSVAAVLFTLNPAAAIDVAPAGYIVLPEGTNAGLLYYQYSGADKLNLDGVGNIPQSDLDVSIGLARYLRYEKIGNVPVAIDAFVAFGSLESTIGGAKQTIEDGFGDVTVGFLFWPISSSSPTGLTVGIANYVTAPTGDYDANAISLGSGTWTYTPQIAFIQGLGNGFWLEGVADVALQADHTEYGLDLSRDPSVQLQGYLRWNYSNTNSISIGYSGLFGGESQVNGVYTGLKTRNDELRVFATSFLTNNFQVQGMLGVDLDVEGGFDRDYYGQLRLLQIF